MRVVLDTNILVSALIDPASKPAAIIDAWLDGKLTLLTCATQVDELRSTLQAACDRTRQTKQGRSSGQPGQEACRGHRSAAARGALFRSRGRLSVGAGRSRQGRLPGYGRQGGTACSRPSQSHADRFCAGIRRVVGLNRQELAVDEPGLPASEKEQVRPYPSITFIATFRRPRSSSRIEPGSCRPSLSPDLGIWKEWIGSICTERLDPANLVLSVEEPSHNPRWSTTSTTGLDKALSDLSRIAAPPNRHRGRGTSCVDPR